MEIVARKGIKKDEEGNIIAGTETTVNFEMGSTCDELAEICENGLSTVHEKACSQIKVDVQARVRALKEAGMEDDAIQAEIDKYVPGAAVKRVAVDPMVQITNKIASGDMTDDERQKLIDILMGKEA